MHKWWADQIDSAVKGTSNSKLLEHMDCRYESRLEHGYTTAVFCVRCPVYV